MADNKDIRDDRDGNKVSASEDYEIRYLAEKLNVPSLRVKEAIECVGNDREKVEEYIRNDRHTDH